MPVEFEYVLGEHAVKARVVAGSYAQVQSMAKRAGLKSNRIKLSGQPDTGVDLTLTGPYVTTSYGEEYPLEYMLSGIAAAVHKAVTPYAIPVTRLLYRAVGVTGLPEDANLREALNLKPYPKHPWSFDVDEMVNSSVLAARFLVERRDEIRDAQQCLVWSCPVCARSVWALELKNTSVGTKPLCGISVCSATGINADVVDAPVDVLRAVRPPVGTTFWAELPHEVLHDLVESWKKRGAGLDAIVTRGVERTSVPNVVHPVAPSVAHGSRKHILPEVTTLRVCGADPTIPLCYTVLRILFSNAVQRESVWFSHNCVNEHDLPPNHKINPKNGHLLVDGHDVHAFTMHLDDNSVAQIRLKTIDDYTYLMCGANKAWMCLDENTICPRSFRPLDGYLCVFPADIECSRDALNHVNGTFDETKRKAFTSEMERLVAGNQPGPLGPTPARWYLVSLLCPKFRYYASRLTHTGRHFELVATAFLDACDMDPELGGVDIARPVFAERIGGTVDYHVPEDTEFVPELEIGEEPILVAPASEFTPPSTAKDVSVLVEERGESDCSQEMFQMREGGGVPNLTAFFSALTRSELARHLGARTFDIDGGLRNPSLAESALVFPLLRLWAEAINAEPSCASVEASQFSSQWIHSFVKICTEGAPFSGFHRYVAMEHCCAARQCSVLAAYCILYGWADAPTLTGMVQKYTQGGVGIAYPPVHRRGPRLIDVGSELLPLFERRNEWIPEALPYHMIHSLADRDELWTNPNARKARDLILSVVPRGLDTLVENEKGRRRIEASLA